MGDTTRDPLRIYGKVRAVPEDAKKKIGGGKLRGKTDINPVWRIKVLTELFGPCGAGWGCEDMGPCVNLDGYRNIRCFYGSSVYDTRQMSRLIDLAVQEAKQLDIETTTPAELERLKEEWH